MKNSARMNKDIEQSLKTLNALTPTLVEDLTRRAGIRSTNNGSESAPKGKGSYSDPTVAAVMQKMSGQTFSDPIYDAVKSIAFTLNDIAILTQLIDEQIRYVTNGAERVKNSVIIHCEACDREIAGTAKDRVRSGYCMGCYAKWTRQQRPYRSTFEAQVKQQILENLQKS